VRQVQIKWKTKRYHTNRYNNKLYSSWQCCTCILCLDCNILYAKKNLIYEQKGKKTEHFGKFIFGNLQCSLSSVYYATVYIRHKVPGDYTSNSKVCPWWVNLSWVSSPLLYKCCDTAQLCTCIYKRNRIFNPFDPKFHMSYYHHLSSISNK
jgi:hypothetical protein